MTRLPGIHLVKSYIAQTPQGTCTVWSCGREAVAFYPTPSVPLWASEGPWKGRKGKEGGCFLSTHRYAYRSCPCTAQKVGSATIDGWRPGVRSTVPVSETRLFCQCRAALAGINAVPGIPPSLRDAPPTVMSESSRTRDARSHPPCRTPPRAIHPPPRRPFDRACSRSPTL